MAVILRQTMPEGVPVEMLDAVSDEMNVDADPPAGMHVHVHWVENGRVQVYDVWDSADEFKRFEAERLNPAIAKVAAQNGLDVAQMPQPEQSVTEVHRLVRGG